MAMLPVTRMLNSTMLTVREGLSQVSISDSTNARHTMAMTAILVWRRMCNRLRRRRIFLRVSRRFSRVDDDIENLLPMRSAFHCPVFVMCYYCLAASAPLHSKRRSATRSTGIGRLNYPINHATKASDYAFTLGVDRGVPPTLSVPRHGPAGRSRKAGVTGVSEQPKTACADYT